MAEILLKRTENCKSSIQSPTWILMFAFLYSFAPSALYSVFFKSLLSSKRSGTSGCISQLYCRWYKNQLIMVLMSMPSSLRPMSGANFPSIIAWKVHGTSESHNFSRSILSLGCLTFLPSSDQLEMSSSPSHGHFLCLLQEISWSYES